MIPFAGGFNQHISKGHISLAMGFGMFVEILNLRGRRIAVLPACPHESLSRPMTSEQTLVP